GSRKKPDARPGRNEAPMAPSPSLKELAEFHRRALALGLLTPEEVVSWADGVIAGAPEPDRAIIDVSLTGHDARRLLEELVRVPGAARGLVVAGLLLARLGTVLAQDPSRWKRVRRAAAEVCQGIAPEETPVYVLDGRRVASLEAFWAL